MPLWTSRRFGSATGGCGHELCRTSIPSGTPDGRAARVRLPGRQLIKRAAGPVDASNGVHGRSATGAPSQLAVRGPATVGRVGRQRRGVPGRCHESLDDAAGGVMTVAGGHGSVIRRVPDVSTNPQER